MEQKAAVGLELGEIDGCFQWWPVFVAEVAGEIKGEMVVGFLF